MRAELRQLGFEHTDLPLIHAFEAHARRQGLDPAPVLQWFSDNKSRIEAMNNVAQFSEAFNGFASEAGIDGGAAELTLAWLDGVGHTGQLNLDEREEAQLHLEEISAFRQEHPDESAALEPVELELISELSKPAKPQAVAASNERAPSSSRLDEIRAMRRDNPDRYERNAAALDREEIALLSGEQHEAPAPAGDANLRELARSDPDGFDRLEAQGFATAPVAAPAAAPAAAAPQGSE